MHAQPARRARRPSGKTRRLSLEWLEERQLLDASGAGEPIAAPAVVNFPWHNPAYRLDVNHDQITTPRDALNLINRIRTGGIGDLPAPGSGGADFFYDTNNDNRLTAADLSAIVNGLLSPPAVEVHSLTPYTIDVTPQVTISATGTAGVPNGTVVNLDVDLNNDGDFNDAGELGRTQSTLFEGSSTFQVTPGLARSNELYSVRLRARVQDTDGVVGSSPALPLGVDTLSSNALANYVHAPDDSYHYSTAVTTNMGLYTYYVLDMTAQTWRSATDVDKPVWQHWVEVFVPNTPTVRSTALLLIDGGHNDGGPPDDSGSPLGQMAWAMQSVIIDLKGIPSEPLTFTGELDHRTEDAIIAYSFDKFLTHMGEPGNDSWPVLEAMVKSTVRAMDTIQDFVPSIKTGSAINDFLVTGYSKRGWTTWLTAAVDDRVKAIIPGVFDNLNQAPQMIHHFGVYGFFSIAVQDYTEAHIFERLIDENSHDLSAIVDPYRYLNNGRFDNMPKLIIVSPGDEFFVSDSAQFYFSDIPGDKNYIRYIPNTGHGLDLAQVTNSTLSFYDAILNNRALPKYSWTIAQDGSIHVQTSSNPTSVKLWQATNPEKRDFRHALHPEIVWTPTTLTNQGGGNYVGDVSMPATGATAYFVELTFANPIPGLPAFVFTTEVHVKSTLPVAAWPPPPGTPLGEVLELPGPAVAAEPSQMVAAAGPPLIDDPTRSAAASALAMASGSPTSSGETSAGSVLVTPVDEPVQAAADEWTGLMLEDAFELDQAEAESAQAEAVDYVFGAQLDELLV